MSKLLLFLTLFFWHAIYISVVEINQTESKSNLDISIKIFTDDLEDAIMADYQEPITLGSEENLIKHQKLVYRYIKDHFTLKVNGQPLKLDFIEAENEDQAIFIHLTALNANTVNDVKVETDILTSLFPVQENIIALNINGKKSFMRLNQVKQSDEIFY